MSSSAAVLAKLLRNLEDVEEDPLSHIIDEYLIKRHKSPSRYQQHTINLVPHERPSGRLSPSSMGGCMRLAAYKFLGVPGYHKINPDSELIMEVGTWLHHMLNAIFLDMEAVLGKDTFKVVSFEEPVKIRNLYVAGSIDAVLRIEGRFYILDLKTINDWGFSVVSTMHQPFDSHIKQVTTYGKARNIPRGLVLYLNKNTQKYKVFTNAYSKEVWSETEDWALDVLSYIRNRKLPPRHKECAKGTYMYDRCPWAKHCFKMSKRRVMQLAYDDFPGIKRAWKRGNRVSDRDRSGRAPVSVV